MEYVDVPTVNIWMLSSIVGQYLLVQVQIVTVYILRIYVFFFLMLYQWKFGSLLTSMNYFAPLQYHFNKK